MLVKGFQVLAVVLCGVAVFLWYRDNNDWAFASLVAGISAAFISLRFQAKERVIEADAAREAEFMASQKEDEEPEEERDTRV